MMRVIGLTGYARSGKDTVGTMLTDLGWHRIAFADNVRALALEADPWIQVTGTGRPVRLSYYVAAVGWDEAKAVPEVRRTLQAIGTGVRTVLGEDTWIDAALGDAYEAFRIPPGADADGGPAGLVVTDVRHPNEAEAVRQRGGFIVRVDRPGVGPVNGHEAEAGVERIIPDTAIDNSGDLVELNRRTHLALLRLGISTVL